MLGRTACSTVYSTPSRRGQTTRASPVGSSASISHVSDVIFEPTSICTNRCERETPPRPRTARPAPRRRRRPASRACPPRGATRARAATRRRPSGRTRTGRPGEDGARERARDLVHEVGAGLQVADPQREPLVADDVDRVREPRPVDRDVERAEREELVALGLDVVVEEHLLARHRHARLQHGRHPGRRRVAAEARVDRRAGPDRVLRPLDRARVVPVRALAHRDGQVRLERARPDLLEDALAQRLEVREARLGVRVLGLEVRDDLGRLLVPQPLVVVVDRLAVVRPRRRAAGRDGRLRRLGRLGLGRGRYGGLRAVVGHLARVVPRPGGTSAPASGSVSRGGRPTARPSAGAGPAPGRARPSRRRGPRTTGPRPTTARAPRRASSPPSRGRPARGRRTARR